MFLILIIIDGFMQNSGQPRRHLLQSGWSVFVSSKRLVAGDAFIFLRYVVVPCPPSMMAIS
jgi:hypothetical protein